MELEKGATAGKLKHEPVFHAKGYMVLHRGPWKALLRYPYYRFRPSHCDALHIDLWHGRANLLRDAGSFGYHIEDELAHHFTGPTGHNTIQFDDRDPMPKLSRFLRGSWLKAKKVVAPRERNGVLFASASYRDSYGTYHSRNVALSAEGLRVVDQVDGFRKRAVLRWRLAPGRWQLLGHKASCRVLIDSDGAINQEYIIEISSDVKIRRLEIVNGWESRYYLKRESVPILEAEICEPGQLVSEYRVL
jgi:hypothetical protein